MPRVTDPPPPRRPAYFWWLLANALALSFAVASWTICLHVFGSPELPRNYRILQKIGRLPELKRHTLADAPKGSVLDPAGLYSRFHGLAGDQAGRINARLMRDYLTNFQSPLAVTYIEGDFLIEGARPLGAADFITRGFAVRARAMVKPDDFTRPAPYPVVIEYLFPTGETGAIGGFRPGDSLSIGKTPDCAVILHISRLVEDGDTLVCLTVVPIAYGTRRAGEDVSFGIEPPAEVNPAAVFPLFQTHPEIGKTGP